MSSNLCVCVRLPYSAVAHCFHVFSICGIEKCTTVVVALAFFLSLFCQPLINVAFVKSNKRIAHRWKNSDSHTVTAPTRTINQKNADAFGLTMMSQRKIHTEKDDTTLTTSRVTRSERRTLVDVAKKWNAESVCKRDDHNNK